MGYRSVVRFATSNEGFEFMREHVNSNSSSDMDDIAADLDEFNTTDYPGYVIFGYDSVKWYEGMYEDVDALIAAADAARDNDYDVLFIRIGEEFDDIDAAYASPYSQDFPLGFTVCTGFEIYER